MRHADAGAAGASKSNLLAWLATNGLDPAVVEREVLALPWMRQHPPAKLDGGGAAVATGRARSAVLGQVLELALDVRDEHNKALPVGSEHLFSAMMLHPRCIGKRIVEDCTDGAVRCFAPLSLRLPAHRLETHQEGHW